jgi:2'-5' RNA ligase
MRLFVAVEISPEVARAAGELIAELRARAERLAPRSRITWVAPDRLHLTVAFIGDADPERAAVIGDALRSPLAVAPFDLTIAGAGGFPKTGQPRVIWAGIAGGRASLLEVEHEVSSRLAGAAIVGKPRAYNPHLTLARVREAGGLRGAQLFDGLAGGTIGSTHVDAITLFDSRLSSKGPTYVPVQRTPLTPP